MEVGIHWRRVVRRPQPVQDLRGHRCRRQRWADGPIQRTGPAGYRVDERACIGGVLARHAGAR
eukprot:1279646-Lingulodinium_polyedra.AAC.1